MTSGFWDEDEGLEVLVLLDEKSAVEDVLYGGGEAVAVEDEGGVVDGRLVAVLEPPHELRQRRLDEDLCAVLGALGRVFGGRHALGLDRHEVSVGGALKQSIPIIFFL